MHWYRAPIVLVVAFTVVLGFPATSGFLFAAGKERGLHGSHAVPTVATNNLPKVQHVILIMEENRTPDNLFNQDLALADHGGHVRSPGNEGPCKAANMQIPLQPTPMWTCWDPDHGHTAWKATWDDNNLDGACGIFISKYGNNCSPTLCYDGSWKYCPYTYVENSLWDSRHKILDPYFQIAHQYGWANYMFQTNQGNSFPAHQFLFSGTSAPDYYQDPDATCTPFGCWEWFDVENVIVPSGDTNLNSGCIADEYDGVTAYTLEIDPDSYESLAYTPPYPVNSLGFPCYNHKTLVDLLEAAGKTWKYYAREEPGGLLAAPNAIYGICQPSGYGGTCGGADFTNNVVLVSKDDSAPILSNITNCKLPAMSWVIPDGNWSDHAGTPATVGDGGPSWVAAIVNAVGNDKKCEGGQGYWSDTVILITWDDWGGYYDDVSSSSLSGPAGIGYPNGTGQQYVYGFRVPLLVVSAYAKQSAERAPYTGYISDYNHDFGSILNFIEYAFGQEGRILGAPCGIGPCEYPYADYFAPEIAQGDPFGLSDFFDFIQSPIPFRTIQGAKYPPRCFHKPKGPGCFFTYPLDADDDASEASTAK